MREKIIFLLGDKKIRLLLLLLGGIFTGLTVAFAEIGFLQWLTLVPAAVAIFEVADDRELRCRKLYGYGFFFFMCYYPVVYHWFINLYPLDFDPELTPSPENIDADYSTNAPLKLAKDLHKAPMEIAKEILERI